MLLRKGSLRIVLTGIVLVGALELQATDWPHWRGPAKNGISAETDWSWDWPASGPEVLWEKQVGTGFASITVCDGRAYTMGNTGVKGDKKDATHSDVVYCFDAASGQLLWKHTYLSPLKPRGYEGGPSASPTIDGSRVYTLSKVGQLFCLDAATGDVVWEKDLVKAFKIEIPKWGLGGSVLVDGPRIVMNAGTRGLALNKSNGSLVWINGTEKAGYSTPLEFNQGGQRCFALFNYNSLGAVNAETGQVLWEIPWKAKYEENIADPIVFERKMLVSSYLGDRCSLFDLSNAKPAESWRHKDLLNWLNSSILWQGYVYGVHSRGKGLKCMDFETGEIKWSQDGFGLGSLMMAAGKLIILGEKGKLAIAEASPEGYKELASAQILKGKCWTVPVLANGRLYARNAEGHLVCLDM